MANIKTDILDTDTMLKYQKLAIEALLYSPSTISNYIHYKYGDTDQTIVRTPLISYNDPTVCCILNKILHGEDDCPELNIVPLGVRGKIGVPYIIKKIGNTQQLVVKISEIQNVYSNYKILPPTSISDIDTLQKYNPNPIKQCLTKIPIENIRYLASDEFTNETLISYILNILTYKYLLPPLFVKHYQGAICSDGNSLYGLNIMENCDLGALDKLPDNIKFSKYINEYIVFDDGREILEYLIDSDIILQLLTQITSGLHMLQNYLVFISGDLKAGNVFVKSQPINTTYMGIKLIAPFTCKIADYGKSSCMYPMNNGTYLRFYNESILSNIYLSFDPFVPEIQHISNDYYYIVDHTFVSQVYTRTMHMGVPFYKSFDFYTVLVSMLTLPAFYYMFFSDNKLKSIFWDPIWYDVNEASEANHRIRQHMIENKGRSISDAIIILRGLKLKCNALNIVLGKILSFQL
jgi:hypothetical protein